MYTFAKGNDQFTVQYNTDGTWAKVTHNRAESELPSSLLPNLKPNHEVAGSLDSCSDKIRIMPKEDMNKKGQNEISHNYFKGSDLANREHEVLIDASERTGFIPDKLVGRSSWWGSSEIGAFHYAGEFEGKKAVLKVQGVKPSLSEIDMINSFAQLNKSKIIRPPYLYTSLPWNDQKRYEALVLEFIEGQQIIQTPTNVAQVKRFFELYQDYRANCLNYPWVDRPDRTISRQIADNFVKWREASFEIYPQHSLRWDGDKDLIDAAVAVLEEGYRGVEPEFMHGHLSEGALYQVGNQVVVMANLYWSWRPPLYDAVFGYHWFIYHLNTVDGITPEEVEAQRSLWLDAIRALPQAQGDGQRLLNLALLERAAAGLNLDALSVDANKPITNYLLESTRNQIEQLLREI